MNITADTRVVDVTLGQLLAFMKENQNGTLQETSSSEDEFVRSKTELIKRLPKVNGKNLSIKAVNSWINQGVIDGLYGEPRPQEYWFNLTQILKRLTSGGLHKRTPSRYSRRR